MKKGALLLIALIALSSLRLLLIPQWPLHNDEAAYAEIIDEFMRSPLQLIPHYLGNPISWKPSAGFYLYLPIIASLNFLFPGISPEFAYRAAPAFFAVLSTIVLFFLARDLYGERHALTAAFIFTVANATLVSTNMLLLDSALLLIILLAIHSYIRAEKDGRWLPAASAFSILAALTKTYVAFLIPLLAFLALFNAKKRRDIPFLLSLLSVPAAMLAYAALFSLSVPDGFREIGSSYIYDLVGRLYTNPLTAIARNSTTLFNHLFPWLLLAPAGLFLLNWKKAEDRLLAWWSALSLIPLMSSSGFFWYFLISIPPLSLLAGRALFRLKPLHSAALLLALLALSLAAFPGLMTEPNEAKGQMEAGKFLAGKGSVLSLTETGAPTVFFYKFHNEAQPDYSSVRQMVANPFGIESYTAFKSMHEIVFETYERNELADANADYIKSLISAHRPANVLMSSKLYAIYSKEPLPNCHTSFSSADLQLLILSCQ